MEISAVSQLLGDIISASGRLKEANIEHNSSECLLLYLRQQA
jgi:hypothetical protein